MVINSIAGGFEIIANDGITINNFANSEYISIEKFPDKVRLFNKLSETTQYFDLIPSEIAFINGVSTGFSTVDLLEKTIISELLNDNGTKVSKLNSTSTLLNAASVFTGTWEDASAFNAFTIAAATDKDGTFTIQFSTDGVNIDSTLTKYYRTGLINPPHSFVVTRKYLRITFTNTSATNQTYLRLQTILGNEGQLNAPIDSVVSQNYDAIVVRPTDYKYEVALGLRQGRVTWDIWGSNEDVDIGTEVVRGFGGTAISVITAATTFTFVSTSVNDTSAGTGAKSLVVYYLDSDRKAQVGVVTLNGTTPVVSSFSGLAINRISIYLAGTLLSNNGTITATETTGGAIASQITAGFGTNQTSVFYGQAGHTLLVNGLEVNLIKAAGGGTAPKVTVRAWVFSFVSNSKYLVYSKTIDTSVQQDFSGNMGHPFPITEKSIFWFEATTDQNNTSVSIRYSLIESRSINT